MFCLVLSLVALPAAAQEKVDADILLAGGLVVDGSGAEGAVGDVAIRQGKIVAIGAFPRGTIGEVIDCQGMVVCPGFIDLHNHSDRSIVDPQTRANTNFLTQGCTTVVTGNCGSGPVDVAKYFKQVDEAGTGTNVIHLLPQGSLRSQVFGSARRTPTSDELDKMRELADKAMRDGAYGMSTGLIYVPGTYSQTDELVEIAKVVGSHGGLYASHIRNEGTELLDAVREALEIGRRAELPVHVSHFKASGREAWGSLRIAAELIERARKEGQKATADQYPYVASSTSLEAMVIPTWAREGGSKELVKRLDSEETGEKLRGEIADKLGTRNKIVIASFRKQPAWVGKSLEEIAESEKRPVLDIVLEITRAGGAAAVSFGMNEEEVRYAMQLPWVATASDGSARLPGADRPHPRSFGTFSRKIGRYALAEKVVSLAAAVRSSSGLPADILGLADRGYLRKDYVADLVVFDPKTFIDHATFDAPYQYSSGARYVLVAGKPAVYDGTPTGALSGKALRHASTKKEIAGDRP
jgi:N-acyl-D-aspartate/D-glutamate deacylase